MKLIDKLWNWGHLEGAHNECTKLDCFMTPEEFAAVYGIRKAFMVSYGGNIQPPFDDFAKRFSCLKEVKWSVLGDSSTPLPDAGDEALEIETLYVNLYFPARWQEELRTTMSNTDGYEVTFSAVLNGHNPIKLFALNFGGSESAGEVVHTLIDENDVAFYVRLRTFPLETEGLSSLDQATVMAMQEDLNYLLSRLFEE